MEYDILIKLLLIGDQSVGKSSILQRFCDNNFSGNMLSTIGIDFKIKTIVLDGKKIKLQIWDTAGQERFRSITTAYYRGAMGILLVYDVTSEKSFHNIKMWMDNIEKNSDHKVRKILVGNKCDCDNRVISTITGETAADKYNIKFIETSAKNDINIQRVFFAIAKESKKTYFDNKLLNIHPEDTSKITINSATTDTSSTINIVNTPETLYTSECC